MLKVHKNYKIFNILPAKPQLLRLLLSPKLPRMKTIEFKLFTFIEVIPALPRVSTAVHGLEHPCDATLYARVFFQSLNEHQPLGWRVEVRPADIVEG